MHSCSYVAVSLATPLATAALASNQFTLEEALALAERRNPALSAVRASTAATQGEVEDARAPLWNNSEIVTEGRRRAFGPTVGPDVTRYDTLFGLSQRFELGGQQRARRGAAEAALRAVQQSIEDSRREVRAEAARRFFQVLSLQQRVRTEEAALELLKRAAELTSKRVRAGEDSRLDGNLAAIEVERGANQVAQASEQLVQARAALSAHLQLQPASRPEAVGELDATVPAYTLNDLLSASADGPGCSCCLPKRKPRGEGSTSSGAIPIRMSPSDFPTAPRRRSTRGTGSSR